ncbi:MAG TPA: bifunctional pyr operon transcriptional regulator/uracil phosphoribosyltransferase PyrR [Rubrivivax sp.]|nr:bifunctional pyr operon transcriptional regulator/uracil phosphoribosyltransferase PyrR [Rubrivivax sp.]HMR69386.1 bifunctional pyr operon transcriptional regulator/uracil phosphoribosyltransferase PyrR [Rubrivivax sp.]
MNLSLDAEALYVQLRDGLRPLLGPDTRLVGIWSGGAWLARRLHADLGRGGEAGVISSRLHRDDFGERGLAAGAHATALPFEVDGADILLVDDVLQTGRTIRAVLNELFDYGRPARVRLAVLVDRGGRELPVAPVLAAATVALPPGCKLRLAQEDAGRLTFELHDLPPGGAVAASAAPRAAG